MGLFSHWTSDEFDGSEETPEQRENRLRTLEGQLKHPHLTDQQKIQKLEDRVLTLEKQVEELCNNCLKLCDMIEILGA